MKLSRVSDFWSHVFARDGSPTHRVSRPVWMFTAYAAAVQFVNEWTNKWMPFLGDFGIAVGPYEVAGGVLSALLVLRVNAGLDRWWEARKLWGGITNQSRNLAILALANGPDDPSWRREFVARVVAFGHVARRSLRGQREIGEVAALIGDGPAARVAEAGHMPGAVSLEIAGMLREARDRGEFDPHAYLQAEGQRCLMVDHIGGCERILKTPLATSYVILVRRFIVMFFLTLPFALMPKVGWLTPLFSLLVGYPIFAIDRIADDLQHPFSVASLNHLPLDDITATIEKNLLGLLAEPRGPDAATVEPARTEGAILLPTPSGRV